MSANIFNPKTGQTGYQVEGQPLPDGWVSLSSPGTLTKDSSTGAYSANAGTTAPGMVPVGPTSLGLAPKTDPYTQFNINIGQILKQIQGAQVSGAQNLTGAKDFLINESVNPNNSTFNPGVFSDSQVAGQPKLEAGFNPAVTSINDQLTNTNNALTGLKSDIGTMASIYAPTAVPLGSNLTTPQGTIVSPAFNPNINLTGPNAGNYIGYTTPPGQTSGSAGNNAVATSTGVVDLTGYASDPNQAQAVNSAYNALKASIPTPTADSIDQYIKGHAKGSPLTGQAIMNVAASVGVDPLYLASLLQHESDFGTAGEAPTNYNPAGIEFTNQPGATQGSVRPAGEGGYYAKFNSWQQGLLATANLLAKNYQNQSSGTSTGPAPAIDVKSDAQALASGSLAPSILFERYASLPNGAGPILYNQAINLAKQINPKFDETAANLAYKGQQVQTENMNSGNPITSIFSNLKNALTTPSTLNLLNPAKATSGVTSSGVGYTILP